jgi:hypothetical protein
VMMMMMMMMLVFNSGESGNLGVDGTMMLTSIFDRLV